MASFFCHECSQRFTLVSADSAEFQCPHCQSGFIEECEDGGLGGGAAAGADADNADPNMRAHLAADAFVRQLFGPMLVGGGGGGGVGGPGFAPRVTLRAIPRGGDNGPAEGGYNFLQEVLNNLAGGGEGQPHFHFMPADMGQGMALYGNPGDYAWGRGGIDAIITQLMNQMEGAGSPPMKKEEIQQIPSVEITEEHLEDKCQCSVCWEDFTPKEKVKQLKCDHLFHENCIVPWLELHDTCPVCRKSQRDGEADGAAPMDQSVPHLDQSPGQVASESSASGSRLPNVISSVLSMFGMPSTSGSRSGNNRPSPSNTSESPSTSTTPSASSSSSSSTRAPSSSTGSSTSQQPQHQPPSTGTDFQDFDVE